MTHDHQDHEHCCDHHHDEVVYNKVVKADHKVASVLLRNAKTLELTFDDRQEMPPLVTAKDGSTLTCDIEEPVEVGDKLVSTTNEWAIISAAPEPLFNIPRNQTGYEAFLHVAGLEMWPLALTDTGAQVIASHQCKHMLEHYGLTFTEVQGPMQELTVPELEHDGCDHEHHEHGPDCGHHHH